MPIFGVKSSFLELGILAVQKRELIIEEVHIQGISRFFVRPIVRNISIVAHFYWKLT